MRFSLLCSIFRANSLKMFHLFSGDSTVSSGCTIEVSLEIKTSEGSDELLERQQIHEQNQRQYSSFSNHDNIQ